MHVVDACITYAPRAVPSIVKHMSILGLAFQCWHISFCLYFLRFNHHIDGRSSLIAVVTLILIRRQLCNFSTRRYKCGAVLLS